MTTQPAIPDRPDGPASGESGEILNTALADVPQPLRAFWLQRRTTILERIAAVEAALHDDETVSIATGLTEAHNLRGLLGTLGFAEGSVIAGRAEDLLIADDPQRKGWIEVAREFASLRRYLAATVSTALTADPMDDDQT